MQKQFLIFTWIITTIIVVSSGFFAYKYFTTPQTKTANIQNLKTEIKSDTSCDGQKNPYYSIGFGIEHYYEGDIIQGKHIKITLSCDHQKLAISGAVSQIIQSSDLAKYNEGINIDLADVATGSEVVRVESDYNFDGYNDLSSIVVNGSRVDTYIVFLYDVGSNTFIYNEELSSLINIYLDTEKKEIISVHPSDCQPSDECGKDRVYYWINGHLQKIN